VNVNLPRGFEDLSLYDILPLAANVGAHLITCVPFVLVQLFTVFEVG